MKAFAKMVSILLALLMVLSLCSCAKKEEASNEWVGMSGASEGAISDTGYYYLNQGLLYYVDFQNGVNVCLCSKAGCSHDGSGCEAEIPLNSGVLSTMFYWNGGIYFTGLDYYGCNLYRRNADGTGQSKVATLCEQYMKEDPEIEVEAFFFTVAGNYVYYHAEIQVVVRVENVNTAQTKLRALLRLDLRTGKEEVVVECEEENKRIEPIAFCNDSAIYTITSYPDVEYGAENYDALLRQCPVQILQWSAETGESKVMVEKTIKEIGYSGIFYQEGKYYCTPDNNMYSIDLETGELTLVAENGSMFALSADYGFWYDYETEKDQLKNLNTGEVLPNEFEEEYLLNFKCFSDDMLILTYQDAKASGTVDVFYAFVKLESLADGLQKEDVTEFHAHQVVVYTD